MAQLSAPLLMEQRPLDLLRPHPRNYRRHPERQLAVLRDSLRIHGQQKPVVITPDGTILAGHGLVEAASAEGWTRDRRATSMTAPTPRRSWPSTTAANELAEDDEEALLALLKDAEAGDHPGGDGLWRGRPAGPARRGERGEPQGARTSTPRRRWPRPRPGADVLTRVQPGELWPLGRHRLLCGDCTVPENWERLMDGQVAQAVVTDPPYAVNYCRRPRRPGRAHRQGAPRRGSAVGRLLGRHDARGLPRAAHRQPVAGPPAQR